MRTSPLGNSDNIHVSVDPGDSFTYEIRIPKTQPPGMYWYHSHVHGLSEHQVSGGLSGALVVEDPAAPAMTERLFVLKDMAFDDDTDNATIDDEWHGIIQSVNGNLDTRLAIRPHEIQVWRFSNQSANLIFHIAVPGVTFRVIAEDAETLVNPVVTDVLNIHPGGRYEVLVEGGAPGEYPLLSKGAITGTGASRSHDRILGHLVVDGEPAVTAASAAPLPSAPDLRGLPVDERRTVVFSETKALKANDQLFFINNRTFNASRVDVRVPLGNNEEWTIRNDSDDMHVFHIHQLGFQVMAVNGVPVDYNGRVDTVRVPERGEVTLLMPFTDPVIIGQFMFHCHVLKHEDKGMMAQVEVYDPRINPHIAKIQAFYTRVWWWLHGVPWKLCGLGDA
jgi:FtsP/CotA-like multicopper oxidase with cupredoxin domain